MQEVQFKNNIEQNKKQQQKIPKHSISESQMCTEIIWGWGGEGGGEWPVPLIGMVHLIDCVGV